MELMHRWSVHSWRGFCSVTEEQTLMQDEIPRKALAHPFLLYGIFAASALDIATSCRDDTSRAEHYGKIALRYYNMGSAQFRQQLMYIRSEIIHLLYLHAVIGACASLAIPPSLATNGIDDPPTLVQRAVTFFNMAIGLTSMLTAHRDKFEQSLTSVRVVRDLVAGASSHDLSEDDETALRRLTLILRTPQPQRSAHSSEMDEKYLKCINRLDLCFRVWSSHTMKGYCLSFPNFCGTQFVAAVSSSDPHALLLLMYWGVILHRSREEFWWIGSLGNELVREIASVVLPMSLEQKATVTEAVSWAVRQTEVEKSSGVYTS